MPKSLVSIASNHSTLNLIGPCNTHHNTHSHKDTYAQTTLTNELSFFKIAQKSKISQKCRKINSIFCGYMLVSNEVTWLALFTLGIEKPQLIYHVKCHRRLLSSFWRNHGYFPWQMYPGAVPSHAAPQFSVVKWSFTTVKVFRATAPIVKLLLKKNLQNNEACTNIV